MVIDWTVSILDCLKFFYPLQCYNSLLAMSKSWKQLDFSFPIFPLLEGNRLLNDGVSFFPFSSKCEKGVARQRTRNFDTKIDRYLVQITAAMRKMKCSLLCLSVLLIEKRSSNKTVWNGQSNFPLHDVMQHYCWRSTKLLSCWIIKMFAMKVIPPKHHHRFVSILSASCSIAFICQRVPFRNDHDFECVL